jgi:Glycosyltransferase family 29 (sialyltransferase)
MIELKAHLIDPFMFFDGFPVGQSLSVVGNSGSLAAWQLGRVIDGADVVVRFNECRLRGWKAQVGERTDLLVTNPYVERRERTIGIEVHPKMAMVIFPHQRRGSRQELINWLGGVPVVMTFAPRLLNVPEVSSPVSISTGTYGLYLVSRLLLPSRMFVTGFSMFSARYAPYYWSAALPPGVAKHDFQREALVFAQLLNTLNHPIEITPDVAEIFEVAQVKIGKHIRMITPEPGDGGNLQ